MASNKAVASYKALKVFEHEGVEYGIGNALVLELGEAEDLVQSGKLQLVRHLDMEDAGDRAEADRIRANPKSFKAAKTAAAPAAEEAAGDSSADTGAAKVSDRMARPKLEDIARAEGADEESIAAATTKGDLVSLIEKRRAPDAAPAADAE